MRPFLGRDAAETIHSNCIEDIDRIIRGVRDIDTATLRVDGGMVEATFSTMIRQDDVTEVLDQFSDHDAVPVTRPSG